MCCVSLASVHGATSRRAGTRHTSDHYESNPKFCGLFLSVRVGIKYQIAREKGRQSFNISDGNFNSGSMRLSVFSKLKLFIIFWIAVLLVLLNSDDSSKPRLAPLPCAQATRI